MNHLQNVAGTQNFKVYLEGIQIPFSSFRVTESERARPKASLSIPASEEALNLLSNTLVHFFGNDPLTGNSILLFEGYITGVSYQKSEGGSFAMYECSHILQLMEDITLWPTDSVMPYHYAEALGHNNLPLPKTELETEAERIAARRDAAARSAEANQTAFAAGYTPTSVAFTVNTDALDNLNYKMPDGSTIPTEESDEERRKEPERLKGFSAWGKFYPEILRGLEDAKTNQWGIGTIPVYNRLLKEFLSRDFFYAAVDRVMHLTKTHYALRNPGILAQAIQYTVVAQYERLTTTIGNVASGPVYLRDALATLNETIGNRTITPASPTYVENPWTDGVPKSPIREISGPTYYPVAPPRCNLFFQDDVNSLQYARSFYGEPTRAIVSADIPTTFLERDPQLPGTNQLIFSTFPVFGRSAYGRYSPEETYKGVFPTFGTVPIQKLYGPTETEFKNIPENTNARVQRYLKIHARTKFLEAKYSQRTCSFAAVWNPYRHIGLPATLVDPENLTIYGILSGISTTFDASGTATSQVSFSAPRIINLKNLENPGLYTLENADQYELIPNPDPVLLSPELYKADVIGHSSYTRLVAGDVNRGSITDPNLDYSVMKYFRASSGALPEIPETAARPWKGKESAYYVLHGIAALIRKASAEKLQNPSGFYTWMLRETFRNIITEQAYWKFVNVDERNLELTDDYTWTAGELQSRRTGTPPQDEGRTARTAAPPEIPAAKLFNVFRRGRVKTLKQIYSLSNSGTTTQDGYPHFVNMRAKNV